MVRAVVLLRKTSHTPSSGVCAELLLLFYTPPLFPQLVRERRKVFDSRYILEVVASNIHSTGGKDFMMRSWARQSTT